MVKRKTKEDFILKSRLIHGDKYDYSKVEYVNNSTKVCIICPDHGEFWQAPNNHISGRGCSKCGRDSIIQKKSSNTEKFIEKAKKIHNSKYDYSKVEYINCETKVCIVCPEHGEFWQTPRSHLQGSGCSLCVGNVKYSVDDFIKKSKEVHGNRYDYSNTEYINIKTKVCIICPKHGAFHQKPSEHLQGQGCPECANENRRLRLLNSNQAFIDKARRIHKDRYDYSKVEYKSAKKRVCIICPDHGEFWQEAESHLQGCGCPKCRDELSQQKNSLGVKGFIKKAREVHGDRYDYSKVEYTNNNIDICIICPDHGEFWQAPKSHLKGCSCPKCANSQSKPEEEINSFINDTCGIETKTRDRSLLTKRLECDILVPSHGLAVEYNGLRWHSEQFGKDKNYHLRKTELAESKGYHLIHIFEDEWLEHKDIVLNKIGHFLGKDTDRPVVGARKCLVKTVSKADAEAFLATYHIQGYVPSTAYYGALYGGKLIGLMAFKQEKPNKWNLTRFATDTSYRIPGLASKIFKQFVKDCNPIEVKTFLDRRWSHGDVNVYDKMGFKLVETLPPDYKYAVNNQRLHKFGFRKQILHKKYGLPLTMTEREMTDKLGFYRIWDCGLYKYVWCNIC